MSASMNAAGVAIVRAPSGTGFRTKSAATRAKLRAERAKAQASQAGRGRDER